MLLLVYFGKNITTTYIIEVLVWINESIRINNALILNELHKGLLDRQNKGIGCWGGIKAISCLLTAGISNK